MGKLSELAVLHKTDKWDHHFYTEHYEKALQHLKHNKHEVVVFHVMDNKTELEFDFEERPMEFIDMESGEKLKLNPADVKDNYRKQIQLFHQELN